MPVELSVRDVREELARAARGSETGEGDRATLLLGRLFHEVFADLVGRDPERSGVRVLIEAGPDGAPVERLIEHTYRALVGPRLARHRAHLRETTEQVLVFWEAIQNLARWLAGITWAVVEARGQPSAPWEAVAETLSAEVSLACELREPGWADAVRLVGIADSLLRVPGRPHCCALELKLGRARPAVDLGQAALYRLIAARASPGAGAADLALVRFSPAIEETLITAAQVAEAEVRLLDLIGAMTRVAAGASPPAPAPAPRAARVPASIEAASIKTVLSPDAKARHAELGQKLARAYREYNRPILIVRLVPLHREVGTSPS